MHTYIHTLTCRPPIIAIAIAIPIAITTTQGRINSNPAAIAHCQQQSTRQGLPPLCHCACLPGPFTAVTGVFETSARLRTATGPICQSANPPTRPAPGRPIHRSLSSPRLPPQSFQAESTSTHQHRYKSLVTACFFLILPHSAYPSRFPTPSHVFDLLTSATRRSSFVSQPVAQPPIIRPPTVTR